MIPKILIGIGVGTGILTLLEIYLTPKQREMISRAAIAAWSWLDDLKRLSFVSWLSRRRFSYWYITLVNCVYYWLYVFYIYPPSTWPDSAADPPGWPGLLFFILLLAVVNLNATVGLNVLRFITSAASGRRVISRAIGQFALFSLPSAGLILGWFFYPATDTGFLWVIQTQLSVILAQIPTLIVVSIIVPLCFAYLATGVLYSAEVIMRGIAGHEKGPLLAISATLTTIGGILKYFWPEK